MIYLWKAAAVGALLGPTLTWAQSTNPPPEPGPAAPTAPLYTEDLRPRFHLTAREWDGYQLNPGRGADGWLNDINGLVYHDGEYHVFAQRWATAWLHWVSPDLVHWTELRPAFHEERKWDGVQSGSAVIDRANVSGLGSGDKSAPMIAFWASGPRKQADGTVHPSQCIAYSNDRGRTWIKYAQNPVLKDADRDPKVFWYEPEKKWVMVLYGPPGGYVFYSSQDLRNWQKMSFLPGFYECPDMFALPLDGDSHHMKWVVVNGDGAYVVGDFDGTTFKPETERKPSCQGPDFYATQTFNNMEASDGRRIQLAWLRRGSFPHEINYSPGMPFNQQMTFPCELVLKNDRGVMRLFRTPVREIEKLHLAEKKWDARTLAVGESMALGKGKEFHIRMEFEMADGAEAVIHFRGENIRLANGKLGLRNRDASFLAPKDGGGFYKRIPLQSLDVLLDRTSIEVYGNEGEASLSAAFTPTGDDFSIECTKGEIKFQTVKVYAMDTIWKGPPLAL